MLKILILVSSVTALTLMLSTSSKYLNESQNIKEFEENIELINQTFQKISQTYNKNNDKVTKEDFLSIFDENGYHESVLNTNRGLSSKQLLDDDGSLVVPQKGSIEYLVFINKLSQYENVENIINEKVTKIKVTPKNTSISDVKNLIFQDIKKIVEILYESDSLSTSKLDEIISKNASLTLIEHEQFKKRLFTHLKSSSNPIDFELYEKIKNL